MKTIETCLRDNLEIDQKESTLRSQLADLVYARRDIQQDVVDVVDELLDLKKLFPFMEDIIQDLKRDRMSKYGPVIVSLDITGLEISTSTGRCDYWHLRELEWKTNELKAAAEYAQGVYTIWDL